MIDITFSVNRYDREGDICEEGIFLHFGETSIRVADSILDLQKLPGQIQKIVDEITDNY